MIQFNNYSKDCATNVIFLSNINIFSVFIIIFSKLIGTFRGCNNINNNNINNNNININNNNTVLLLIIILI